MAGKTVLVTGAGGGFGRLIAVRAAAAGSQVVCADIDSAAAEATAAMVRDGGGEAEATTADVTRIADMRAVVARAVKHFGAVDVLVNNAGIMPLAFMADHDAALEAWHRCIDINFKGVVNGTAAVHDQMISQGRGHIVNISSIFGNHPVVGAAVYGATKAAVNYFSNSVRQESRGRIKVTVVKPTGVAGTGLGSTVVNGAAGAGILGQNAASYVALLGRAGRGEALGPEGDAEQPDYANLAPEHIADAVINVIDQPWGVTISDVTIRATGDYFIL